MGMAVYYNVSVGSFHKGNVVADFIRLKLNNFI